MSRLVLILLGVLASAAGLHWLADRPGTLVVEWQGYVIERTVFEALVMLALTIALVMFVWSLIRTIWKSPAKVGQIITRKREQRGLEALSAGMIAIGSGDRNQATRAAVQARKALPNEPLTHLLRAQTAQLSGDRTTARRLFEAMLASPDTEALGLRGLFLEAEQEKEFDAARQFAERALKLNPKSEWPVDALLELQCKAKDWNGALETIGIGRKHGQLEKSAADRKRAVILTGQAMALEDGNPEQAMAYAQEAHALAPHLAPAAAVAGRILASRGQTGKAAKILMRTWKDAPHPELATVYTYARPGDSLRDRLERSKQLMQALPGNAEGAMAFAEAAIASSAWDDARAAMQPYLDARLTQRVCTTMARIESGAGHAGAVREWLARAVNAPRDPAWTADGVVSENWAPISPVTGRLDAFQWKIPVEMLEKPEGALLTAKIEEFVKLGLPEPRPIAAAPVAASHIPHAEPRTPARPPIVDIEDAEELPVTMPADRARPAAASTAAAKPPPVVIIDRHADARLPEAKLADVKLAPHLAGNGAGSASHVTPVSKARAVDPIETARKSEPKIYVPPRAPDDPGLDNAVQDTGSTPLSRYRSSAGGK